MYRNEGSKSETGQVPFYIAVLVIFGLGMMTMIPREKEPQPATPENQASTVDLVSQ